MLQPTHRLPLFVLIGLLFLPSISLAQIYLKPNGQNAVPLRMKSITADVAIDKQFADAHLTLTFQNETSERIEADFIYTLPSDSLVTSFAYWYGDEKVVARVVEKEEAEAIYTHITTRMRDPALVEMIGKNTFRARIFPVMPNSDLKVEMTLAQTLPSDRRGAYYSFPMRMERGATLDSLHLHLHVRPDADIEQITNNLGLPVGHDHDGYSIALNGTNYRPQKDLRIDLVRPTRQLHAALYAAPSGGADGFFALALTPDCALARPEVHISGLTTYQVIPTHPSDLKAHQALVLVGRYKGSSPATITLSGSTSQGPLSLTQRVHFGSERLPENLATRLWAARWMEWLSRSERNRSQVISLSKRFGLPGRYTSWLAVPKEEMERYNYEIAAAKIEIVARRLAQEISLHHKDSPTAKRLRVRLNALCKQTNQSPEQALGEQLYGEINTVAARLAHEICNGRKESRTAKRLQMRLNDLCKQTNQKPYETLNGYFNAEVSAISHQLTGQIANGSKDALTLRRLKARRWNLWLLTGVDMKQQMSYDADSYGNDVAQQYVQIVHTPNPDHVKLKQLLERLHTLEQLGNQSVKDHIQFAEYAWDGEEVALLRERLISEYRQPHLNPQDLKQLEQRFTQLDEKLVNPDSAKARLSRLQVHVAQEQLEQEAAKNPPATPEQIAWYNKRQAELEQQESELRVRMGDPLISIEAPTDALRVIALMPGGEIKELRYDAASRKWEARFDIPTYITEGDYVIRIVIVLKDGTRKTSIVRYHVDLTPPRGTGQAQRVADPGPMLRLEMDASEDTARVKALLPWGTIVNLIPTAQPHHFFGLVSLPPAWQGVPSAVTYVLTDRAHNRTIIRVDMAAN